MAISRRQFLGGTGAAGTSALFGSLGLNLHPSSAFAEAAQPQRGTISTTVCPFCGVGCGQIVETRGGRVVNIEGDPDHPINEGSLCSKGAALYQVAENERRLKKIRYRKPGSPDWEDLSWDRAMAMIVERVKRTRDATWVGARDGRTFNHTTGIASLGGAALDTEECYLLTKAMRALGVVWLEHQARI
jgi:formate dehydrogenase major subunit